uniref:Uncharacterized protein n=1 Tax=Oryza punctata TaxID=4537 RepID=A0A0E0JRE5_ORYPU
MRQRRKKGAFPRRKKRERESGARRRRLPLPHLAAPSGSTSSKKGKGLSGEGTRARLVRWWGKHHRTLLRLPGEGELVGEEGEEEVATEEEQAPAKVKNQKVIPIHWELLARKWMVEVEAADNELQSGAWMTEDAATAAEL